jgi:hypothetical protein
MSNKKKNVPVASTYTESEEFSTTTKTITAIFEPYSFVGNVPMYDRPEYVTITFTSTTVHRWDSLSDPIRNKLENQACDLLISQR